LIQKVKTSCRRGSALLVLLGPVRAKLVSMLREALPLPMHMSTTIAAMRAVVMTAPEQADGRGNTEKNGVLNCSQVVPTRMQGRVEHEYQAEG